MNKKKPSEFHQLYNEEWEKMPIFQGWLSSVKTSKFRAYCKYCKKEFRAHRTDLRTHAHSRKHQKSADAYYENEENLVALKHLPSCSPGDNKAPKRIISLSGIIEPSSGKVPHLDDDCCDEHDDDDDSGTLIIPDPHSDSHSDIESTQANIKGNLKSQPELKDESIEVECLTKDVEKPPCILSTEVHDMVKGLPVDRLVVYLYVFRDEKWVKLGKGFTEKDGACSKFMSVEESEEDIITAGQYKLHFETKMYYTLSLEESLFPFIEVPIDISDTSKEHKIKLLISPYSFVVFRGS